MCMHELLIRDYAVDIRDTTEIANRTCYYDDEHVYFTVCVQNREAVYMEQAVLATFLKDNGCGGIAWPIQNSQGQWFSKHQSKQHLVFCAKLEDFGNEAALGELLAHFHLRFSHYPYEPKLISSYGKWKTLWSEKLDYFEERFELMAKQEDHPYCHSLSDIFSYIVGISENAIQYMRETEQEKRFGESDQGTVTFYRCTSQLLDPVIWPDELMYDHPARDLAEYIRPFLLAGPDGAADEVRGFLAAYESVQPISVFGWRLIYARLLFPVHLFDVLEALLAEQEATGQQACLKDLRALCSAQEQYEQGLRYFFEMAEVDTRTFDIPELDWLAN